MKEDGSMQWKEVRELFPNQFIKFTIVKSHITDGKEIVDELEVLKTYSDGKEAMKEFINRQEGQFVYSTKNEKLVIDVVRHIAIKRRD